ncbi:MAG TPA: RdgB/HAM1 family non-canonical purine NTP pyrophosphatase [Elusimicrobiota bacterium]|nr:RdgB/HAM1 family non-canonical purine NTP pyrophosphatase [Elusimicrobiota bacterium]
MPSSRSRRDAVPPTKEGIVLATHNAHKVKEIMAIFEHPPYALFNLGQFRAGAPPRETGKTLEENAVLKAVRAAQKTKRLAMADDTGLEVDALEKKPGVYSARFAGPRCNYDDNNRKLLKMLRNTPPTQRQAAFRCVVVVAHPKMKPVVLDGKCPGRIALNPRGTNGFGYDPVFEPLGGKRKTFAQMTLKDKNKFSHRARAFLKARRFLQVLYKRKPHLFQSLDAESV